MPVARLEEDLGVVRGAIAPYGANHQRVECKDVDFPIDLGVWRSLTAAPAIFAIESAMDELALQQGKDPDFKLAQLQGQHPCQCNHLVQARARKCREQCCRQARVSLGDTPVASTSIAALWPSVLMCVDAETQQIKVCACAACKTSAWPLIRASCALK